MAKSEKPKTVKVKLLKNFEGQLNDWKIKAKEGDLLTVNPHQAGWLKSFGVIK